MAKQFDCLSQSHIEFIGRQKIFFTASAAAGTRVNMSPREGGALRVAGANEVVYLDRTGSGNETAAHMLADGRLTIMFCAFEGPPLILRLYGQGTSLGWESAGFSRIVETLYDGKCPSGARQIMRLTIDLVQTSCGYGVPLFDYQGERAAIDNWHDNKGPDGIRAYWKDNNQSSMDGLPTGLKLPDDI
ncbi:pyridoxamine 5'-phosphate oxidase family protein [uncultured Roseobacter sp.]|uniref:pyridoxamine 5'-phosphate oxidase family protein n=1 Tax=uncultured Roseobacter sp. TaxID=114847 RepID=UPI0026162932|nr:pyridoxamine 5'-phosphate oxidase family protein [uncultured Roseobacter sp.]